MLLLLLGGAVSTTGPDPNVGRAYPTTFLVTASDPTSLVIVTEWDD